MRLKVMLLLSALGVIAGLIAVGQGTYASSGGAPQASYALDSYVGGLATGRVGLAWSADGTGLFTVAAATSGVASAHPVTSYALRVLSPPLASSALTLRGPTTPPQPEPAPLGEPFKLRGTLTINNAAAPAGTSVIVTRTAPGGAVKTLAASTTTGGAYSVSDTLTALGTYSYTARYAGTSSIAPATTAAVTVAAIGDRPALTLNGHAGATQAVGYKAKVTLTAHLGTTHSKRTVGIYEQLPNGTERLLKTGAVNAAGNLATTVTMTRNLTFSAVFPGDAEDLSVTAYDVIHVRPVVTASIGGYARTIKLAGVTYRVYHHTTRLTASVAVTPDKHGECFKLEAQSNAGSWNSNVTTACATLSTASKGTGYLTLTKASYAYPYRVRADFVPGKSDSTNVAGSSGWLYFIVEK